MRARLAVVDTNVVVAGLLTRDPASPTARILDGMLAGAFPFLLSVALLEEYRTVLLRLAIARRHRRSEEEVDFLLTEIALQAIVRDAGAPDPFPAVADTAADSSPDPGDQHLWDLARTHPGAILVTGDKELQRHVPPRLSALSPASFLELLARLPAAGSKRTER